MPNKKIKTVDGWLVQGQHMPWLHEFYPIEEYPTIEAAFACYIRTYDAPRAGNLRKYARDLRGWRVTQTTPRLIIPKQ